MFKRYIIQSKLDAEILASLEKLEGLRENSDEYADVVDRITKLEKLKPEGIRPPSLDTVLIVGANVFGILWLAQYERNDVIKAPNAFRTLMRPR
jgi:hypothetical protein